MVFDAIAATAHYGIVCLTGISPTGRRVTAAALARADLDWLDRLITRRVPLDRVGEAFDPQPDDVKVVITLDGS